MKHRLIRTVSLPIITGLMVFSLVGCSETIATANSTGTREVSASEQMDIRKNSIGTEMRVTEKNQQTLNKVQPSPQIDYSLERENLIKRFERFNDPNKIGYIYLLSQNGTVVSYHTVKGKISSVNSRLTTGDQLVKDPNFDTASGAAGGLGSLVVESPSEDGSYGTNGDGIFFYDTKNNYVEWKGDYHYSDAPMKLTQEPIMVQQEGK